MLYKKVPLVNISDYLTFIKLNPEIKFQFDIIRKNAVDIQVFGHELKSDTSELQNHNDYIVLAYFDDKISRSMQSKRRLIDSSNKIQFKELKEKGGSSNYFIRIDKDLQKLHKILKFLIDEIYEYKKTEFYSVNFYEIISESEIKQITYYKQNRLRRFFQ